MQVWILACCAILTLYHHVGYPALLRFLAKSIGCRGLPAQAGVGAADDFTPSIGMLIPAHDEERVIGRKIINCAELDYPEGKFSLIVVLDGCNDNTAAVLESALAECPLPHLRTAVIHPNIGKIGVLNRTIPEIQADLVALSDTSALLRPEAVRLAAAHFADPRVGVVCGTYVMPEDASPGEQAYWDYQIRIKSDEALVAAPMGAHGAFYMFRRALWTPLEPDTINDDFILPMRIVAAGWKAIYDREVIALELEPTGSRQNFRRRVRIGAGNLQQTLRLWKLANPMNPGLAFVFVSGKALRSLMPFILLAGLFASVWLAFSEGLVWKSLLGAELAVGLLAFAAAAIPTRLPRVIDAFTYLVQGHVASGLGSLLLLSGQHGAAWRVSKAGRGRASPAQSKR